MKLGDVLRKERERKKLTLDDVASQLGISVEQYQEMEAGNSQAEEWGPRLALIAIKLQTATAKLIAETGKSSHATRADGLCGKLIRARREKRGASQQELAAMIELSASELQRIEEGRTPLETYGPLLLSFSELVDQPIFNIFYPCGLPLDKLPDYP
jgi:transcriptional regulator with XRE-family HTH domain